MNMEAKEGNREKNLIANLLNAASEQEWEKIDDEIIPQLAKSDGNIVAEQLLEYVDETPDIRDAVATGLAVLRIKNREIKKRAIEAMIKMAEEDEEMFPSGRAAVFLLGNRRDPELGNQVMAAIETFRTRVKDKKDWIEGLSENIRQLKRLLTE